VGGAKTFPGRGRGESTGFGSKELGGTNRGTKNLWSDCANNLFGGNRDRS